MVGVTLLYCAPNIIAFFLEKNHKNYATLLKSDQCNANALYRKGIILTAVGNRRLSREVRSRSCVPSILYYPNRTPVATFNLADIAKHTRQAKTEIAKDELLATEYSTSQQSTVLCFPRRNDGTTD
jgi:hypothetical protein